jgi:hypothetical protein
MLYAIFISVLISSLSVRPLCSLRLCGESTLSHIHHRVTEDAEDAQSVNQFRTLPYLSFS